MPRRKNTGFDAALEIARKQANQSADDRISDLLAKLDCADRERCLLRNERDIALAALEACVEVMDHGDGDAYTQALMALGRPAP